MGGGGSSGGYPPSVCGRFNNSCPPPLSPGTSNVLPRNQWVVLAHGSSWAAAGGGGGYICVRLLRRESSTHG